MGAVEGPIFTDQDGGLNIKIPMCGWGDRTCRHLGVHEFHYYYCAAQDAENKHAAPNEFAYPWHGAGKHLFGGPYPKNCPFHLPAAPLHQREG